MVVGAAQGCGKHLADVGGEARLRQVECYNREGRLACPGRARSGASSRTSRENGPHTWPPA
eukprot:7100914-Prymnesium_polylepis.1